MAPRRIPTTRQVNFRLPTEVWEKLDAAAGVLGLPQSRIVADALDVYLGAMSESTRRVIADTIKLRAKNLK